MCRTISAKVTIEMRVTDPVPLWRAARATCLEMEVPETDYVRVIGTEDEPDLRGCLVIVFSPSESVAGTMIEDCTAEVFELS